MLKNDLAQTIRQLCEDVLSEPTPRVLQEKIIPHVQSTFPVQWSTLWLTEQKDPGGGKRLRLAAASGVAEKLLAAEAGGPAVFDFGEGLPGATAKSGEICNITTYDEFKAHSNAEKYDALMFGQPDGAGKRRCVLGVPLMLRSPRPVTSADDSPWRVIGVLELDNVEQSAGHPEAFFTSEDVEMVKAYAAVIAVALQKAQLRDESNRIGAGLLEVSQSLIAELGDPRNRNPHEIVQRLEEIVQQTANVMSAEACSLWLRSGLELRLAAAYGYSCKKEDVPYYPLERKGGGEEGTQPVHTGDLPDEELYRGVGLTVYVAKTRECLNLTTADEIRNHFAWRGSNDESMWNAPRGEACYSLVALPLIDHETDDLRGVFKVENKKATLFQLQSFFTSEDQRLLTILGNSISFSLIVSDRIERLRRLEKLVGDFRVLYDQDEALFFILTGLTHRDGLKYNRAMIYLVDGDSDKRSRLICRFAIGEVAADDWQRNVDAMLDQPPLDLDRDLRAFRLSREKYRNNPMMNRWNGHVIDIDDAKHSVVAKHAASESRSAKYLSGDLSPKDMLSGFAHGDFVLIPITVDRRLLGVIYADNRFTGDRVNRFECSMLDLFAGMAGAIIEASDVPDRLQKERDEAWKAFSQPTAHRLGTEAGIIHNEVALYIKPELDGAKPVLEGMIAVRGEVIRNSLNVIEQAVSRLRFAVKDYQRLAYEKEKTEDFDLCELVATTIEKTTTQLRGIKVLPPQQGERPLVVHAARGGITYVLEELLINAWKEGHPDGDPDVPSETRDKHRVRVWIELRREKDQAVCILSDNGLGIRPPARMEDLFKKPMSGKRGGTGLGLYLCAQILEASGGKIELLTEGQPKGFPGACFRMNIPLSAPPHSGLGTVSVKPAPNILVVEDNPTLRRQLVKLLTDNGFTCDLVQNENEAVGRLSATLRVIVADLNLEEAGGNRFGGLHLANKVRDMGRRTPVVLVSHHPGYLTPRDENSLDFKQFLDDNGIFAFLNRNRETFFLELVKMVKEAMHF